MLMTTMLALTHARKVLEKALLKRNTKTLTMMLESCTYQLWCLVSAQVKSFCIGGGAPADLQDRDEFKDEMKIIDAGLKEVAGIVDPVETPMRDGDDDGLGGDQEELSLVMKPTWQNLALDGPLAEKKLPRELCRRSSFRSCSGTSLQKRGKCSSSTRRKLAAWSVRRSHSWWRRTGNRT